MARFVIKEGTGERVVDLREGVLTVGRAPENDIVIADKEFSRRQFQVERTPLGYKLIDLESRNGTRVNGRTVNQHLLRSGDRIEIGSVTVLFEDGNSVEAAPDVASAPVALLPAAEKITSAPPRKRSGNTTAIMRRREFVSQQRGAQQSTHLLGWLLAGGMGIIVIVVLVLAAGSRHRPETPRGAASQTGETTKTTPDIPESPAERAAFDALYDLQQNSPHHVEEIIRLAEGFKTNYPKSPYLTKVEEYLRRARDERSSARRREVDQVRMEIDETIRLHQFRRAVSSLQRMDEKYRHDMDLRPTLDQLHARIVEGGRKHYEEQAALAEKKRTEGDVEGARQIYTDLISILGDGSLTEFEDHVRLARACRDQLR